MRDRDNLIASACSGMLNGAFFGYFTSGPWAIIAGSLTYAALAAGTQYTISIGRRWRQNVALDRHLHPEKHSSQSYFTGPGGLFANPFLSEDESDQLALKTAQNFSLTEKMKDMDDPVRHLFMAVRDFLREYVIGEYPEWASPFVHALDMEYRNKLNLRIEILEAQLVVLREEIIKAKTELESRK